MLHVAGGGPNAGHLIVNATRKVRVDVKQFTAIVDQSVREHMRTV